MCKTAENMQLRGDRGPQSPKEGTVRCFGEIYLSGSRGKPSRFRCLEGPQPMPFSGIGGLSLMEVAEEYLGVET